MPLDPKVLLLGTTYKGHCTRPPDIHGRKERPSSRKQLILYRISIPLPGSQCRRRPPRLPAPDVDPLHQPGLAARALREHALCAAGLGGREAEDAADGVGRGDDQADPRRGAGQAAQHQGDQGKHKGMRELFFASVQN